MKILKISLFLIIIFTANSFAQDNNDILGKILNEAGLTRADLGYDYRGYWNRFPLDIPYRLTSFDDLFKEPLKLYDYAIVMGNVTEKYLDPHYSDSTDNGLYQLVYNLGVDRKLGGFRSYSANLLPPPEGLNPMPLAFERLFALADKQVEFYTFGNKADWPDIKNEINNKTKDLPDSVKIILAELIVNLTDAIKWRNLAFRNCDREDMEKAFMIRDLANTQSDGMIYYPELDDIAATIDLPSLHYATLKVTAASEKAERSLIRFIKDIPNDFEMELETPFGKIVIFSPKNKINREDSNIKGILHPSLDRYLEYDATNTLLLIDFGQNCIYQGTPGATSSLVNPISVLIDLGGNDFYGYNHREYQPNSGVGLLGIGLVIDSDGDDTYNGSTYSQGAGLFGVGVLLDRKGNDHYNAELSAQGCGYFGIGLCLDQTGDDNYYLFADGQGLGGVGGGIGVCASFEGNDKYTAEPYSDVYNRGDYHSENKINGNSAQGAGFGRRGDGSDGHSWAGGLGAIIDIHGDDYYYSGNWTLGVGYWFSTGIALDRNGNDLYESCYFTQGSGAHFCNGILIDEAGDDRHELFETAGAGLGFGWDFTNAFLINNGGNDIYRAKMISMGLAQIRSNAFLIDIMGDDKYYLGKDTPGLGEGTYREGYAVTPTTLTTYYSYAKSFGGFIDIGGNDQYHWFNDEGETAIDFITNNSTWLQPTKEDSLFGYDNYGVGIDIEEGIIPELEKWEK
ncbi:MAG: hypothetical protein ABIJ12_10450 [bacterium]